MSQETAGRIERIVPLIMLVLTVLFWGFSFISTKILLAEFDAASIAFFRQLIAVVVLLPWVIVDLRRARESGEGLPHLGLVAASGLFGIVLYFICENNGIRLSNASSASMIVSSVPIFILFAEALFFRLRVKGWMVACLLVSVPGVWLVVTGGGKLDLASARFLGNLLVLGAMFCWVVYTVISKKLSGERSVIVLTFSQSFASIFLFLPFILPEIGRWHMPSGVALAHLLYLGICCSALGYFFYVHAVNKLGAAVSAAFLNLVPVVTIVCGYFVLGEKVTLPQLLGMALILASLYALVLKSQKDSPRSERSPGLPSEARRRRVRSQNHDM